MGASSVTGVSGNGSAEGFSKGPGNGRNIYAPLSSPHIIYCGRATLTSGGESAHTTTVSLPTPLPESVVKYGIFLQVVSTSLDNDSNVTSADVVVDTSSSDNGDGQFYRFTIHGTFSNTVVNWMIVSNVLGQ